MNGTPGDIVRAFIDAWNRNEIEEALTMLSDDVFYHNIPMSPLQGVDEVRSFLSASPLKIGIQTRTDWEMLNLAENGEIVLTERIDHFYHMDGRAGRMSVPLMGAFRVVGGKITEWRDYFDLADFQAQVRAFIAA